MVLGHLCRSLWNSWDDREIEEEQEKDAADIFQLRPFLFEGQILVWHLDLT